MKKQSKSRTLDQFYTQKGTASLCMNYLLEHIKEKQFVPQWWIEPAVGTGSLWDQMPSDNTPKIALDLDPGLGAPPCTIQTNFLTWTPALPMGPGGILFGNPPFGKNSSLAVQFFNHAAMLDGLVYMGWIVPKTFCKNGLQNRLDLNFELEFECDIPKNSFVFENFSYDVPTVFQIWRRRGQGKREKTKETTVHPDFTFQKKPEALKHSNAFSFQRVGGQAGKTSLSFEKKAEASHYFILPHHAKTTVQKTLNSIDWNNVKHNTAGNPSIGKKELIRLYQQRISLSKKP